MIDLTFWNNNEKLWVTVALDTFISLAGRVKTKVFYSTFDLDPYDWHNYLVIERSVFEIAFVMCILYLTAVEIQQIYAAYRRGEMEQLDHFTGLAFWVPPGIHWYYLDGETGKFNYSDLLQLSLYYTQVVATYTPGRAMCPPDHTHQQWLTDVLALFRHANCCDSTLPNLPWCPATPCPC